MQPPRTHMSLTSTKGFMNSLQHSCQGRAHLARQARPRKRFSRRFSRQSSSRPNTCFAYSILVFRGKLCSVTETRSTSDSGQESSGEPAAANGSGPQVMLANRCPANPHARSRVSWLSIGAARGRGARRRAAATVGSLGLVAARRSRLRQLPALTSERSAQLQQSPANDPVRASAAAMSACVS